MSGPAIIDLFVMTIMIILDVRSDRFVLQGSYELQINIQSMKFSSQKVFGWLKVFLPFVRKGAGVKN